MLSFLDQQNEDLSLLLEATSVPEEFLRDPSYWMKASEMESFLQGVQKLSHEDGPLFQKIGHAGPELRSWGVLDSVLRMMPRPHEIFNQPQRFLSYFISPEPPVENVFSTSSGIEFDLPISSEIYPLVTTYLKAAFESLPVYVGQAMAQCSWNDIHVKLNWASEQESIFEKDPGHQISPELLRSVVSSLEKHQRELEEKNRELQERNEQLSRSQQEIEARISQKLQLGGLPENSIHDLEFINEKSIATLNGNVSKLSDYMVRAQQLITLLVGQDRLKPVVKEAMRRTDWERVKAQYPLTVQESRELLENTRKQYQESQHV
jgi:hypothetical protein